MANPQTERGFVMLALDVFAALVVADLPKREWIVLSEVLMVCYGRKRRRDVFLDPISIEDYSGLHRNNVRRALAALVAKGILRRNANGSYRFEKDWESWKVEGAGAAAGDRPALVSEKDHLYAGSVVDRLGIPKESIKGSKKEAIPRDIASTSAPIPRDMPDGAAGNPVGLRGPASATSNGIGSNAYASEGEAGRNPLNDQGVTAKNCVESLTNERAPARAEEDPRLEILEGRDVGVITPTPPACVTDRNGEPIDLDLGVVNDPAEVERVAEWAVEAFVGLHWGQQVRVYAMAFPIRWIERALQDARAWRNPPRSFQPVLNELRRWRAAGGPPELDAGPARNGRPAAPADRAAEKSRRQREDLHAAGAELREGR